MPCQASYKGSVSMDAKELTATTVAGLPAAEILVRAKEDSAVLAGTSALSPPCSPELVYLQFCGG